MAEQTPKLVTPKLGANDFVRLVIDKDRRYKLRFKHAQLRNAVLASGRSIGQLLGDPFGGWVYLLAEGHRPFNPQVTLENASDWIDSYVNTPDADGQSRDLTGMDKLLTDALLASGFLKLKSESNEDEEPEGNDQPEVDN